MGHTLTSEEQERCVLISACIDGHATHAETAAKLRLTIRQVQRLKRRVEKEGETGIVHAGRGKPSNRKTSDTTTTAVTAHLTKKKCAGFGPTFAQEQLAKKDIALLSVETVRTIMSEHGLWKPRERKMREIHRQWRERRAMRGELVQFDGSYHQWFEDRGAEECLLAAIDDADNSVTAVFEESEGVYAVFRFWDAYFKAHGLPVALYLDKFSTYKINHKNAVDNAELMTQFRRAMQELTVEVINANSPQAKGRIARLFGTLHVRLNDTYLAYTALPERPERVRARVTALTRERPRIAPPPGHPWRKPFLTNKSHHIK